MHYADSTRRMKLVDLLIDEGKAKGAAMDVKCPRKLNLDLPLLSTRSRPGASTCGLNPQDMASNRVPFSWELAPGKPKDNVISLRDDDDMDVTPRPRPPPCRWKPVKSDEAEGDHEGLIGEALLDAVDALSLTEAIDIAQKAENDHDHDHDDDDHHHRLTLESSIDSSNNNDNTDDNRSTSQSSNFMIQRFLPDATAIAAEASSVVYLANDPTVSFPDDCSMKKPRRWRSTRSSSKPRFKGCGLQVLYSWRAKHRLCGVKNPGKQVSPNMPPGCGGKLRRHFLRHRQPLPS